MKKKMAGQTTKNMAVKTTKCLCAVLAVLALTACSNSSPDDDGNGNDNHIWHVTLQASMNGTTNRVLTPGDGNAIIASFEANDEVVVVDADGSTVVGILKAKTAGGSATLEGPLNNSTLAVDEDVTLHYLSNTPNYDNQTGTLEAISSYAVGTLKVKTLTPLTFVANSVSLAPRQSVTKFSFKDKDTNAPVNVKTFGIAAPGLVQSIAADALFTETVGAVTGTLLTPSPDVYVALRNNTAAKQTYSFYISDDAGNWYTGTKNANLANGKNYTATVTLTKLATTLSSSSAEGDVGVIDQLPAIVIEHGTGTPKTKVAVALMNTGALCPEHYGSYYTFASLSALSLPAGWRVPTKEELEALVLKTKTWASSNGVNGCMFTIAGNALFLPAAGFYDNTPPPPLLTYVTQWGYYWSSSSYNDEEAYSLQFNDDISAMNVFGDYKTNLLTLRPFHPL